MDELLFEQGWAHDPSEGLVAHLGGLWHRIKDGAHQFGFLAQPLHANRNGVVHGGMLMVFVDRAFGQTARVTSGARRAATISLNHQFMAPMAIGTFAVITPKVAKVTTRLAFMEGTATCDGEPVVSAQGVWRLARSGE
jgi:uncharacterized protein (TIGR00369 family)